MDMLTGKLDPLGMPAYRYFGKDLTSDGRRVWEEFASRHRGNKFLENTTVYALTAPLIDRVMELVPDFFDRDEGFERDLAVTAPIGFFDRVPIGARANWSGLSREDMRRFDEGARESARLARAKEFKADGIDAEDAAAQEQREQELTRLMLDRQESYLGWLVTQRAFWSDLRMLRKMAEPLIAEFGFFPPLVGWYAWPKTLKPGGENVAAGVFHLFYARWSLEALLTWELPRPLLPLLLPANDLPGEVRLAPQGEFEGASALPGPALFAPWYLLRDESMRVSELLWSTKQISPPHLKDWFAQVGKRKQSPSLGPIQLQTLFYVYLHLHLGLRRRYPEKCKGNLRRIETAIAAAIGDEYQRKLERESVTKARQAFDRALRDAEMETPAADVAD